MKISKENIRTILKEYMLQENLGFINVNASMSVNKDNVVMCITEEEEDDPLRELLN